MFEVNCTILIFHRALPYADVFRPFKARRFRFEVSIKDVILVNNNSKKHISKDNIQ